KRYRTLEERGHVIDRASTPRVPPNHYSGNNGATADRPVINGVVIGRNAGRGSSIYDVSPFLERPISFSERVKLNLRAEAFNVFNHPNFVGYVGVYGNGATAPANFGAPAVGITNQLPAR